MSIPHDTDVEAVHDANIFHEACFSLPTIAIPSTRNSTDFVASFSSLMNDQYSVQLIEKMSSDRQALSISLELAENPSKKLVALDSYLVSVFAFKQTMERQATVCLDKKLSFEWKCSFSYQNHFYKCSDVVLDLILTLFTKVTSHI